MRNLPMEIRHFHGISVHEAQRADASTGEISCCGTAQAAGADEEHLGVLDVELA